jgi:hypothetical protein
VPRINRLRRSREKQGLSLTETWALLLGPTGNEFASDAFRKAAWWEHREALLADVNPTTRPWGFWQYEQGGKHPAHGQQAARLAELGLLTDAEQALLRRWGKV